MRREIETEPELDVLSNEWDAEDLEEDSRIIHRMEDVPRIEDVSAVEIRWVVDGIIVEGAVHAITGESGDGKSTFLSALGYSVSRGNQFLGRATSKRPVLILDAENPSVAVCERFRRLRIRTDDDFRIWGQWVGEDAPSASGGVVLEWVSRCDPKPLIVIDCLIAFNPGAENDSTEMRRFMARYRKLAATGTSIALIHHSGKSDTSGDYRGSSDFKANLDVGYKLANLGDGTSLSELELRTFKQRFSVIPLLHLRYDDGIFSIDQADARRTSTERLCDLLKDNPGIVNADFEALAHKQGLGRNRGRAFLRDGVKDGTVRVETGGNNRRHHYWRS
jgi:hypothetical protein